VSNEPHQGELTCRELVELVTDYVERAMPSQRRLRFEEHIAFCAPCARYLDQMRQTIVLTGRLRADDLDPEWREAMLRVFREFAR
jgi:Putative zinc-finger